ncbi:MAG: DUF2997 domain-containing protein [Bdellovibrionales bacterium]|nr:DUF2997 domain-containing protein [Bdellovibrionales bacterium]
MKKELIITIAPNGSLKIKTVGLKGTACEDELKPIERAMGRVTSREKTSEYYEKDDAKVRTTATTKRHRY